MKLKIYRISLLITHLITAIFGVYVTIITIINLMNCDDYLTLSVYLIAMIFGLIYVITEIVLIIKSFYKGTLMIDQLLFHHDTKKLRKGTFVIAVIGTILFLALFILGILIVVGVIPLQIESYTSTDGYFTIFCGLFIFLDCLALVIYGALFYKDQQYLKSY